jgi:nucleotide sugar dehydrogenase
MSKKLNLAVIGHGFVGSAVDYGFPDANCNKTIIDPKYGNSVADLEGKNIDVSFVCVPTPMGQDASIDASILIQTVQDLMKYTTGLIVIKSTVIPSIISNLTDGVPSVIYNPEFLTEKAANEDFVNPVMHVFGGVKTQTEKLEQIYEYYSACKPCPVYHMTPAEASFVKYGMNSFLATKVLFFNQLHNIVDKVGGNYNIIRNAIGTDPRIGHSHTMVPGHDGKKGFSGSCFPKDSAAFVMFARDQEMPFTVLEEVVRRNQEYRNANGGPTPREKEQNISFDYDI